MYWLQSVKSHRVGPREAGANRPLWQVARDATTLVQQHKEISSVVQIIQREIKREFDSYGIDGRLAIPASTHILPIGSNLTAAYVFRLGPFPTDMIIVNSNRMSELASDNTRLRMSIAHELSHRFRIGPGGKANPDNYNDPVEEAIANLAGFKIARYGKTRILKKAMRMYEAFRNVVEQVADFGTFDKRTMEMLERREGYFLGAVAALEHERIGRRHLGEMLSEKDSEALRAELKSIARSSVNGRDLVSLWGECVKLVLSSM